jgi:hypothetical protein
VVAILRFFYSSGFLWSGWWDVGDILSFLSERCLVEIVGCGCRTRLGRSSRERVCANPSLRAGVEVRSGVGGVFFFFFFFSLWSYFRTRLYRTVVGSPYHAT